MILAKSQSKLEKLEFLWDAESMLARIENIVFDFDGTLMDTMSRVVSGLQKAVESIRGEKPSADEVIKNFIPSTEAVVKYWARNEEERNQFLELWRQFGVTGRLSSEPFDGVEEMLTKLKELGIGLFIFTGRERESTLSIVEAQGWLGKFFTEEAIVCGDDGFAAKPSEEGLLHLIEKFDLNAPSTLMVGDHLADLQAGRAAGMTTGAVLWDLSMQLGNTRREKFKNLWNYWDESLTDVRLKDPSALYAWVEVQRDQMVD